MRSQFNGSIKLTHMKPQSTKLSYLQLIDERMCIMNLIPVVCSCCMITEQSLQNKRKNARIKSETSPCMTLLFQSLYLQQVQLQLVECKKKVVVFVDGFGQVKKNWWCRSSGKLAMDKGKQPSFACRLMLSVSGSLHFSVQRQNCLPNRLFFSRLQIFICPYLWA